MAKSCCNSNRTRIIKIGGHDTGVIDLDNILMDVYSLGFEDEKEIKAELLKRAKDKNYIPESRELYYSVALMSEYKKLLKEKVSTVLKCTETKMTEIESQKYSVLQRIKKKLYKIFA